MNGTSESVTKLLNGAAGGDAESSRELLGLIYDELHVLARARLGQSAPGTMLQPTDLVHEAYLRLFRERVPLAARWNSRAHFFSAAAQAMRNIMVEQARRKASLKRGGGCKRVDVDKVELAIAPPADDVLALDELLTQLECSEPRKAKLVLLHCFSGLTLQESAAAMDLSLSTVEREWRFTRALLRSKLEDETEIGSQ